ncbi:MAG TPA: sigma-70 family RNA polymerase sigma factor [Polyangia bacterium]|jgi:RNA polymerase sigma-70 factor (ECF subfamily)|nr:sigma-70 family RNA polymerase sigma factor [Polyangia bacterium]
MGPLTSAFQAARVAAQTTPSSPSGGGPNVLDDEGLESLLDALARRGRTAHPEIAIDEGTFAVLFAAHLGRCHAAVASSAAAADGLHAEDLYLACAALLADEKAVAKLRRVHRPVLAGYLRHIDGSPGFVDEVEQRLWDAALVGTGGAAPKLTTYSGQGKLAGWVGIAAQRIALMMRRHEAAEERAAEGASAEAERMLSRDPELAFMKQKLRDGFRDALSRALATLEDRERMIYRLHLVDGLTVETIGRMYSVSHSTVSRWLAKAREAVLAEAQRLLKEQEGLTPDEFASVAALMVSQLDLSVSRIFKKGAG